MSLPSIQELLLRREAKRAFYKENSQGHDVFSKDIYKIIEDRSERFLKDNINMLEESDQKLKKNLVMSFYLGCFAAFFQVYLLAHIILYKKLHLNSIFLFRF